MTESLGRPTAGGDESVHQPNGLAILVVLKGAGRADFTYLKATPGLTDANLGRHLGHLEGHGLLGLTERDEGRRCSTWARLTPTGRRVLDAELVAMRWLLQRFERWPRRVPACHSNSEVHPARRCGRCLRVR